MNTNEPLVTEGVEPLKVLALVEKFWRMSIYCRDEDRSTDFYDDYFWRYAIQGLHKEGSDFISLDEKWLGLVLKIAAKAAPGLDFFDTLPLWLALRVLSWKKSAPADLTEAAKAIFTTQKDSLECFLEERGFDIDWESWEKFFDQLNLDDVKPYVTELLKLLAAYIQEDRDKLRIQQWAEAHGLSLNGWGKRLVKDSEREALIKLLAVE